MKKTNAARILDRLKIDYELKEYKVDLNDLSAIHVAKDVNMDIKTVFKTLVARSDKNDIIMACIPGDDELHLKKLAQVANFKKVEMIHLKELLPLTGYVRGGCSPLRSTIMWTARFCGRFPRAFPVQSWTASTSSSPARASISRMSSMRRRSISASCV